MEAVASGKIVIASDIGGISEIIRHNMNGFLVKPKKIIELKKYVLDIYDKKIQIKKGLEKGFKFFKTV